MLAFWVSYRNCFEEYEIVLAQHFLGFKTVLSLARL